MPIPYTPVRFHTTADWKAGPDFEDGKKLFTAWVYAIKHDPTRSIYIGATRNPASAHRSWYQRLAGIDQFNQDLNVAFRAIFTHRRDFTFTLIEGVQGNDPYEEAQKRAAEYRNHIAKTQPREKLLNVETASMDAREFWMSRVPKEEFQKRFGTMMHGGAKRSPRAQKRWEQEEKMRAAKANFVKHVSAPGTNPLPTDMNDFFNNLVSQAMGQAPPTAPVPVPQEHGGMTHAHYDDGDSAHYDAEGYPLDMPLDMPLDPADPADADDPQEGT